MNIIVNGHLRTISPGISLQKLLEALSISTHTGIAVARNRALVRRDEWATTILEEGDELEILQASAGG